MQIYGFVYKVTNTLNGKIYVGQHIGEHFGKYWGSGLLLNRAYEKYGKSYFKREIIEYASSKEELNSLECKYINELNSFHPYGYNIATGGRGGYTGECTEESRQKIKKALTGRTFSEEHRKNISKAKKGYSRPHTPEEKEKMSKSHMGIAPWNKGKGKKIEQLTLEGEHIKMWNSLTEAKACGYNMSKISECLHGTRRKHKECLWRVANG